MRFLKLCPKKPPCFLHWHGDTLPRSHPPQPRPSEQQPGHGASGCANFHILQTGSNWQPLFRRLRGPARAAMLHRESAITLHTEPAAGQFGFSGNGGARAGPGRSTRSHARRGAAGEVLGYLHELRGSPAHRLGGRDQPFGPARVLGIKLLRCCCPLLL